MPIFAWDSQPATKSPPPQDASPPPEKHAAKLETTLELPSSFDIDKNAPFLKSPAHASMPHRVEPSFPMSSSYASSPGHRTRNPYDSRPSPPPIATLAHSPSPSVASLDRSTGSTPRRTPPHAFAQPPIYYDPSQQQSAPPRHHHQSTHSVSHPYMYTHPPFDPRYTQPAPNDAPMPQHPRDPYAPAPHHNAHAHSHPYPLPGQPSSAAIYTDDAATKLSDRVRRRCFNCCTTDTSTWRRSNLSPGKVLCNKCGLFERTHSRPRPEQFPHKRGPLAASTLRQRTPPHSSPSHTPVPHHHQQLHQQQQHLPPISPPPQHQHQHHYSGHSIAPLHDVQDTRRNDYTQGGHTLPALQSWHNDAPQQVGMQGPGQHHSQPRYHDHQQQGPGQLVDMRRPMEPKSNPHEQPLSTSPSSGPGRESPGGPNGSAAESARLDHLLE